MKCIFVYDILFQFLMIDIQMHSFLIHYRIIVWVAFPLPLFLILHLLLMVYAFSFPFLLSTRLLVPVLALLVPLHPFPFILSQVSACFLLAACLGACRAVVGRCVPYRGNLGELNLYRIVSTWGNSISPCQHGELNISIVTTWGHKCRSLLAKEPSYLTKEVGATSKGALAAQK